MTGKCADLDGVMHAIGGMPDHVHLIVTIPPGIAVAEFVRQVKGISAYQVNREYDAAFAWQAEFGAFTLSQRNLVAAIAYVRDQGQHHADGRTLAAIEPPKET